MPDREPPREPFGASGAAVPRFLDVGARWSWRIIVIGLALYALWLLYGRLRVVMIAVFVAVLFTAFLQPVVDAMERRRIPRIVGTWLVLLAMFGAIGGGGYLVAQPLVDQFRELGAKLDTAVADLKDWARDDPLNLSAERVDSIEESIRSSIEGFGSGFTDRPADTAMLVAETIGGIFLALVLIFFFVKDGSSMWRWFLARVQPTRRDALDQGGRAAYGSVQGWLRGVAITGFIEAALIGIALAVLGVPAALPLAIITFFAAFFPVVGAIVAGVLATAVALVAGGVRDAVIIAIVALAVQQLESDVLTPLVMRRTIKLHPAATLLALAAGAALAGLVGALIAVPLVAAATAATSAVRKVEVRRVETR